MEPLPPHLDHAVLTVCRKLWRPQGPLGLDDVEQIGREAALLALQAHDPRRGNPASFVRARVAWRVRDAYRAEPAHPPPVIFDLAGPDEAELTVARLDLGRALRVLSPAARLLLFDVDVLGRTYPEAAAVRGISVAAVKSRHHRAILRARARLTRA